MNHRINRLFISTLFTLTSLSPFASIITAQNFPKVRVDADKRNFVSPAIEQ